MWKNRLKELLYILENSNVNEIDVTFFGVRYRVVKELVSMMILHFRKKKNEKMIQKNLQLVQKV